MRRALQEIVPGFAYVRARTLEGIVAPEMRSWRLGATMFTIFGVLALVVAAIGLYSVVAYDVSQRIAELGVRVALGASTAKVLRLVVADGVQVVTVGLVVGVAAALLLAGRISPLLYEVSEKDPATLRWCRRGAARGGCRGQPQAGAARGPCGSQPALRAD